MRVMSVSELRSIASNPESLAVEIAVATRVINAIEGGNVECLLQDNPPWVVNHNNTVAFDRQVKKKREKFCQLYARGHNGADSARRAGWIGSQAKYIAYRLLKKPEIRKRIAELEADNDDSLLLESAGLHALRRAEQMASFDVRNVLNPDGSINWAELFRHDGVFIKSIKHGKDGIQVNFVDPLAANAQVLEATGWRRRVVQHEANTDKPIIIEDIDRKISDAWIRLLAHADTLPDTEN